MDILNKPIKSFDFAKIETFCQEGIREGLQIDYKKELPRDGLSKLIAAFSNTRGGVIIIGVEENRTTGVPSAWTGIPVNAQDVERIHQWASNITPFPLYEVHPTNEVNGRNFILIRVFEGDRTPYYVQNDPKIYVRTGNITPSVDLASPEATELLVRKKENAEILRNLKIQQSNEIYEAALHRGEIERKKKIAVEKANYKRARQEALTQHQPPPEFQSKIFQQELGSNASIFSVILQPYYPTPIVTPRDIKERLTDIRDGDRTFRINFPSVNMEPIPEGVMTFSWREDYGGIHNEQIYSSGFVRLSKDVLNLDLETGYKFIYISHLISLTFAVMKATTNFYKLFEYQGGIKGSLSLKSTEDIYIKPVLTGRETFPDDDKMGLLQHYYYPLELDTSILNDKKRFQDYFINLINEIFWIFGFEHPHPDTVKAYLESHNWLVV